MLSKSIERRHHAYIFQTHNLHESLTALQNVKMGLELHLEISIAEMNRRSIEIKEDVKLAQSSNLGQVN
jgi:putative ABC transport system ATP-binding protein